MQRRILIVDDHDDLKTALTEVFDKLGFFVKATMSRISVSGFGGDALTGFSLFVVRTHERHHAK